MASRIDRTVPYCGGCTDFLTVRQIWESDIRYTLPAGPPRGPMKRTVAVLICLLFVAACGSARRHQRHRSGGHRRWPAAGGGGGGDASGGGGSTPAAEDGSKVGTLDNPCSAEKAEGAAPTDTPGVTDTEIRIGVISDRKNDLVPVPTIGVEEATEAFVAFCNDSGGINGRKLVLKKYDSQILRTEEVTKQACADNLFALVGDGVGAGPDGHHDPRRVRPARGRRVLGHERALDVRPLLPGRPRHAARQVQRRPLQVHRQALPAGGEEGRDDVHRRRGVVAARSGHHRGL